MKLLVLVSAAMCLIFFALTVEVTPLPAGAVPRATDAAPPATFGPEPSPWPTLGQPYPPPQENQPGAVIVYSGPVPEGAPEPCVNPETGARYWLLRFVDDGTERGYYIFLPCAPPATPVPVPTDTATPTLPTLPVRQILIPISR